MEENTNKKLKDLAVDIAFRHFFNNVDAPDFPETEVEVFNMLYDGTFKKDNKNLIVWFPYENKDKVELADMITDSIFDYLYYLTKAYDTAKEEDIYILALTSNMDDDYNEINYAFHKKEDGENELKRIFNEILKIYEFDIDPDKIKKTTQEMENSLKETDEKQYRPEFEIWTCYGFIKGTLTRTKVK